MLLFDKFEYSPKDDLIGKGPIARVYKALDRQSGHPLALKFYRDQPIRDIEKMLKLDHPNLCRYTFIDTIEREDSFGEKELIQVAVMPLCGKTVAEYYRETQDLDLLQRLVRDILQGLSYLHQQGLVHRRIKQENLRVRETEAGPQALITDFGIDHNRESSQDGHFSELVFAVPYMAPEQFNPQKYGAIAANIDLWGLGVSIYEAITKDVLFVNSPDDSRQQVMQNILMPRLPEKAKQLPHPFNEIVSRCLVKQVSKRAQTAEELLQLFDDKTADTIVLPKTANLATNDTTILPKTPSNQADDTVVLPKTANLQPDDTVVLSATGKLFVNSDDDTVILPLHKDKDETQILSRDNLSPTRTEQPVKKNPATDNPVSNSLFNRYEYNAQSGLIGKGGFSRVYKAYDRKLSRHVALKIYKTGEFSDRYSPIAEIRRVVNLDHPNICRYLDIEEMEKENAFGERELTQICVMELLDGGNLLEYYSKNPTTAVLKKLIADILHGLAYLHKNGIIHRDIKPANILIKETLDGPVAKITDFGISKVSESVNSNSSSALVVSIPYMAPEQLNQKKYGVDQKITYNLDLWSLGVTIYEVATGDVLFKNSEQDSSEQIMTNIMAPELPEKIKTLPQPFRDIVSHCVIKDAYHRVQRAEDLLILLQGGKLELPNTPANTEKLQPYGELSQTASKKKASHSFALSSTEEVSETQRVRFATEEGQVKRPMIKEEHSGILKIAIVASVIVISMGIYIFIQNRRLKEAVSIASDAPGAATTKPAVTSSGPATTDSAPAKTSTTDATGTPPADRTAAANESPASKTAAGSDVAANPTGAKNANTKTPPSSTETQPTASDKKPKSSSGAGAATGSSSTNAPHKYVLLLSTPQSCSVTLNNINYGTLESGKTMKVYLTPGNYVLQATSTSNGSLSYTGKLVVTEENLNQVGEYKIPL